MPAESKSITYKELLSFVESMQIPSATFTGIATEMLQLGITEINLPLGEKEWEALEILVKAGQSCVKAANRALVKHAVKKK